MPEKRKRDNGSVKNVRSRILLCHFHASKRLIVFKNRWFMYVVVGEKIFTEYIEFTGILFSDQAISFDYVSSLL